MVLTDFSVDNTKGDRRNIYCKQCVRAYHHSHKGPISDNKKNYYELHKEEIKQKRKEYRKFNPEKIKLTQKKYYEAHKVELNESSSEYRKDWREKNKLKIREQARLYYQKHKERIYDYRRKRVKTDIQTRLAQRLRCRLRIARKNNQKKGSAIRDLGCSLADLMVHIEKLFYNHKQTGEAMHWGNYGLWHVDHILPLSSFDLTDIKQVKLACHYTNLQPLWAIDNQRKGSRIYD